MFIGCQLPQKGRIALIVVFVAVCSRQPNNARCLDGDGWYLWHGGHMGMWTVIGPDWGALDLSGFPLELQAGVVEPVPRGRALPAPARSPTSLG